MKIPIEKYAARFGPRTNVGIIVAVLLTAALAGGWAVSTMLTTTALAVDDSFAEHKNDVKNLPPEGIKPALIGSYAVTGTDPDGTPYVGDHTLDISLAPSGALELKWDNGKHVGVGQVVGNALAVAYSIRGRTVILVMSINPDGSLSGAWSRRTDRGQMGTEAWTRT